MTRYLRREHAALITLAVLLVLITFITPQFYSWTNLRDVALANVSVLLIASGMTLVIVVAQIDISVGSMFAICGVGTGLLVRAGMPIWLLPLSGIVVGLILGSINGGLVSFVKAPSIVVTLATMVAWREALNWATGGAWVEDLPTNFQWFGLGQHAGEILLFCLGFRIFPQTRASGSNCRRLPPLWSVVLRSQEAGADSSER
jgi:rhamnose transport system permease protein